MVYVVGFLITSLITCYGMIIDVYKIPEIDIPFWIKFIVSIFIPPLLWPIWFIIWVYFFIIMFKKKFFNKN